MNDMNVVCTSGLFYHIVQRLYNNHHILTLKLPGPAARMGEYLDTYYSLKPLCSGMGEVVPARTSPTLLPPSPRTYPVSKCLSASIVVTSTLRVNGIF